MEFKEGTESDTEIMISILERAARLPVERSACYSTELRPTYSRIALELLMEKMVRGDPEGHPDFPTQVFVYGSTLKGREYLDKLSANNVTEAGAAN